jgi:glutaredoxin
MSKLTVYTKDWCGYCVQVKNQLADMRIEFEEINIEDNAEQKDYRARTYNNASDLS